MLKRIFAFLLAMVLLVGAIPMASVHVHAEDAEEMILEELQETEPVTEETEPVTEETEPVTEETEPVTEETEPVTEETEPVTEETEPVTEATEPVTEETEPVTEETEPVTEETEPVTEETEPVTEETEPVTEETEPTTEEEVIVEVPLNVELNLEDLDLPSDEDVFAAYVEHEFYGTAPTVKGFPVGAGTMAGAALSGNDKVLYDAFIMLFKELAEGKRADTTIAIGQQVNYGGKTLTPEVKATFTGSNVNWTKVLLAVMTDLPYEHYWYDKTADLKINYSLVNTKTGDYVYLELAFVVAVNYRGSSLYSTNQVKTRATINAANTAKNVVAQYAGYSDYEKLVAYKDWICNAVTYDHAAAGNGSPEDLTNNFKKNNDPWQMIYAFDNNPSTNIVCEGYSKAFMYLCDMSTFAGDVSCITVSGIVTFPNKKGGHMWNVVTASGKNYLVDVTNSDAGAYTDGSLFMAGATGSVAGSYNISTSRGIVNFAYYDYVYGFWGTGANSKLYLAAPGASCKIHGFGGWTRISTNNCTEAGKASRRCSYCGFYDYKMTPGTAHSYNAFVTAPTCTTKGYTTYSCAYCSYGYIGDEVAEYGHNYVNNYCTRCGVAQCTHSFQYSSTQTKATCVATGVDIHKCSKCGETKTVVTDVNPKNHNYVKSTVKPTAGKKGYDLYTCSYCGDSYKKNYKDALGLKKPTVYEYVLATSGKPFLEIKPVTGAEKYYVYRATSKSGSYKYMGYTKKTRADNGNYFYEDTKASVGKTYYYKVKAVTDDVKSSYSSAVAVRCICAQPILSKWYIDSDSGKLKMKWSKVSGAKKYEIYRATSKNGTYKKIKTTTSTSFTDSTGSVGKTYYYKLKAIASSSKNNSIMEKVKGKEYFEPYYGARICAKADVSVKVGSNGYPYLSWDKVSGAAKYEVYRFADAAGNGIEYLGYVTGTSCYDYSAEFGKTYYYGVRVRGKTTETDNGLYVEDLIKLKVTCAKPSVSIKLSSKKPKLSWKAIPVAQKYEVYRATSKSGKYTKVATVTDATSYTDKKAKKGKTYYYKVKAIGPTSNTNSGYSSVKSIKVK